MIYIRYDAVTISGDHVREYCKLPYSMDLNDAIDFVTAQPCNDDIRYYIKFSTGFDEE